MSDDNGEKVTAVAPETTATSGPGLLGRLLWLSQRVSEARESSFRPGQPGYVSFDIARQICDDVVKIGETGKGSWAVLLLDCSAVEMLVRAHLERAGLVSGAGPLTEADWDKARSLPAMESAWGKLAVAHADILKALVGPERDATLAKLEGDERESFATGLHDLVMRLAEPLEYEANRLGRALFARWSRVAVTAIIILVIAGVAGKWISRKIEGPNLALHKPVVVSSQYPGQGTDHSLLVDGNHDNLGFHTNSGGQQWALIDLGQVRKIKKVVVYNRADGYEERAVPLKIEVSNDNQNFKVIAERKETFDKWTAKGLKAEGRYVRLSNTPPNFFHLAEVEIY
jgi:hypothetical protein